VPVSYRAPAAVQRDVIADAGVTLVLVGDGAAPFDAPDLTVLHLSDLPTTSDAPFAGRERETRPTDVGMILYTSGSTGGPKGVELSHGSHLWVQSVLLRGAGEDGTVVVAAPLYHMNALANAQQTLARGATLALLPAFDADLFIESTESGADSVTGVPPMFALALDRAEALGHGPFEAVTNVFVGSAPASDQLLARIEAAYPNAEVAFRYGTSESGPVAFGAHPDGLPVPRGSVGYPSADVDLRLVGADGRVVPSGGILEVSCGGLMNGYRGRDDLHPITPDGYYHTKDIFDVDEDGFYFFRRRSDEVIVVGGENIHPQAVAEVLEQHPDVVQAVVVGLPDVVKGMKPWAEAVLRPGATTTGADLRAFALEHLEPNAAPRAVHVVDALPLSTSNKVDARAVADRIAARLDQRDGGAV
jgi:acyl-CoA synthetase (AMP-forming)/AMP-acid ligase II